MEFKGGRKACAAWRRTGGWRRLCAAQGVVKLGMVGAVLGAVRAVRAADPGRA